MREDERRKLWEREHEEQKRLWRHEKFWLEKELDQEESTEEVEPKEDRHEN